MLITFKTSAYANIIMFGDVGLSLLKLMGFGTSIPGAIDAKDVAQALASLESSLASLPPQAESSTAEDDDDEQPAISLQTRALPLIELLRAAANEEAFVRWE